MTNHFMIAAIIVVTCTGLLFSTFSAFLMYLGLQYFREGGIGDSYQYLVGVLAALFVSLCAVFLTLIFCKRELEMVPQWLRWLVIVQLFSPIVVAVAVLGCAIR